MEIAPECYEFLYSKYKDCSRILWNTEFKQLKDIDRHYFTDTYDHSIRVAVGAAIIAEMTGADIESAIRVGLLHDMCFVKRVERREHKGLYAFYHPVEAAENADLAFGLTEEEIKAIRAHMFPLAIRIPTSKVALALTLSDKLIAIYEGLYGIKILRCWMANLGLKEIKAYSYAIM